MEWLISDGMEFYNKNIIHFLQRSFWINNMQSVSIIISGTAEFEAHGDLATLLPTSVYQDAIALMIIHPQFILKHKSC